VRGVSGRSFWLHLVAGGEKIRIHLPRQAWEQLPERVAALAER